MTGTEIIAMQKYFLRGMHNYAGDAPTTDQALSQVNWGIRALSRRLFQVRASVTFTLTANLAYYDLRNTTTFSHKIIKPFSVIINRNPLLNASGDIGLYSLNELERVAPGWRTPESGTPSLACHYGGQLILFQPPTSTVVSTGYNYVCGQYLAADLTTSSETPDIPEELHECIAYFAAVKAAMPEATDEVAWLRINAYNQEWQSLIKEIEADNRGTAQDWGTTQGYHQPDYMVS